MIVDKLSVFHVMIFTIVSEAVNMLFKRNHFIRIVVIEDPNN